MFFGFVLIGKMSRLNHPLVFRFLVGVSCIIIYFMTFVDLIEKFAKIWEKGEKRFESQSPLNIYWFLVSLLGRPFGTI